jgi:hypothetical protein
MAIGSLVFVWLLVLLMRHEPEGDLVLDSERLDAIKARREEAKAAEERKAREKEEAAARRAEDYRAARIQADLEAKARAEKAKQGAIMFPTMRDSLETSAYWIEPGQWMQSAINSYVAFRVTAVALMVDAKPEELEGDLRLEKKWEFRVTNLPLRSCVPGGGSPGFVFGSMDDAGFDMPSNTQVVASWRNPTGRRLTAQLKLYGHEIPRGTSHEMRMHEVEEAEEQRWSVTMRTVPLPSKADRAAVEPKRGPNGWSGAPWGR